MKERWIEHTLNSDERPLVMYEYYVTGYGVFPFDMLRHDQAWPATSDDAVALWPRPFGGVGANDRKLRSIKLYSYKKPNLGRWSSFIWSVGIGKL